MDEKIKILVIEDNPKHLKDVQDLLEDRIAQGVPLEVNYVSTLDVANEKLANNQYAGIMSDVFFPNKEGDYETANGVEIMQYAFDNGLPFVLVTSLYHHDSKVDPISWQAREKGMELIDLDRTQDELNNQKNWAGGYLALMYFIESIEDGSVKMHSEGFETDEYGGNNIKNLLDRAIRWLPKKSEEEFQEKLRCVYEGDDLYDPDPLFRETLNKYCKGMFD